MRAAAVVRTRPVRRTGVADDEQCSAGCDRCSRAAQNRPTRNLDLRVQEARGDEVEGRQRLPLGEVGRDPGDLVAGLPGSRPRWPVPSGRCRRPSQSIRYGRARAHRPLHRSRGRERCPVECRRPRVRGRRSPCRSRTCRSPGNDSPNTRPRSSSWCQCGLRGGRGKIALPERQSTRLTKKAKKATTVANATFQLRVRSALGVPRHAHEKGAGLDPGGKACRLAVVVSVEFDFLWSGEVRLQRFYRLLVEVPSVVMLTSNSPAGRSATDPAVGPRDSEPRLEPPP